MQVNGCGGGIFQTSRLQGITVGFTAMSKLLLPKIQAQCVSSLNVLSE